MRIAPLCYGHPEFESRFVDLSRSCPLSLSHFASCNNSTLQLYKKKKKDFKRIIKITHKTCYKKKKKKKNIYIYRGGTVHVFVPNHHGNGHLGSVHEALRRIQAIHPNPEGGAHSNATLFDNRQQKNSECRELRT